MSPTDTHDQCWKYRRHSEQKLEELRQQVAVEDCLLRHSRAENKAKLMMENNKAKGYQSGEHCPSGMRISICEIIRGRNGHFAVRCFGRLVRCGLAAKQSQQPKPSPRRKKSGTAYVEGRWTPVLHSATDITPARPHLTPPFPQISQRRSAWARSCPHLPVVRPLMGREDRLSVSFHDRYCIYVHSIDVSTQLR